MKGTIETPRVSKIAMSLLSHLFYDVVLTLEKSNSDQMVFSKQMQVRKNMKAVQEFVLTHPYSKFNIEVLDSLRRDKEDPMMVLSFRNFGDVLPDKIPLEYHIILDETYTTFEAYQNSMSGILLKVL